MVLNPPLSAKSKKKKMGRGMFSGLGKPNAADNDDDDDDDDDDEGLSAMAPGRHYNNKSKGDARGRGANRGENEREADRSRSRSRASVSRAFKKLVGKPPQDQDDMSKSSKREKKIRKAKGSKKNEDLEEYRNIPQNIEAYSESIDVFKKKKKKKKPKGDGDCEHSVASFDMSGDDDILGSIVTPITKRKKKKKVRKEDISRLPDIDDDVGSKSSKVSSKKKTKKRRPGAEDSDSRHTHDSRYSQEDDDHPFSSPGGRSRSNKKPIVEVIFENDPSGESSGAKDRVSKCKGTADASERDSGKRDRKEQSYGQPGTSFRSFGGESSDSDLWKQASLHSTNHKENGFAKVENKNLANFDTYTSSWNESARSQKSNDDATDTAMAEAAATLNVQLEEQQEETQTLQKSLSDALSRIAELGEDLRREQTEARKSKNDVLEVRRELNNAMEESNDLLKTLDRVEKNLVTKEELVDSLETVVETQLDRVEFLEDKLAHTEDELFNMEDDLKDLEQKGILNDESTHSKQRMQRVDSIRRDRMFRAGSMRLSKEDILGSDSANGPKEQNSRSSVMGDAEAKKQREGLVAWEKELKKRERELDEEREQDDLRERRLDEWERDLVEKESEVVGMSKNHVGEEMVNEMRRELDERERLFIDGRETLEQELAELAESKRDADKEIQRLSELANSAHRLHPNDDKEREITDLRAECEDLIAEKQDLVRRHEEEDGQRDEDLRLIQGDINEKLISLDTENQDLRQKVEEADEKALKAESFEKVITLLEEEIRDLKKSGGTSGVEDQDDAMHQLQLEIAEQLAELDEENQRMSEKLAKDEKQFQHKLKEKDEVILDLEDMLEDLERNLESGDTEAYTATLMKELTEEKKKSQASGRLEEELSEASSLLQEKEMRMELLEDCLKQAKEKLASLKDQDSLVNNARVKQLEDELEATRAVIEAKTSDVFSQKLKEEIRTLKEYVKELKKTMKAEQQEGKAKLKKKDGSVSFMQKEMAKMRKELERHGKKEKRRLESKDKTGDGNSQEQIEDLEDEIDHWKVVNFELEDELAVWKAEATELKTKINEGNAQEENFDDDESLDGSIQSFQSQLSRQRTEDALNMSHHSLSSITPEDLFFVSDKSSVGGINGIDAEPTTPSQRAMRTVTSIWSKMTDKQPPGPRANPAIPYTMSFDD